MPQISGLTVRHHTRAEFDLVVEFIVNQAQREQVRFSAMSTARSPHCVRGRATDISSGGLGFSCTHYLPRGCEGRLRILRPGFDPDETAGQDDVTFEHDVKVRRVVMIGDEPMYAIGVAFIAPSPDLEKRVEQIIASAHTMHVDSSIQEAAGDA